MTNVMVIFADVQSILAMSRSRRLDCLVAGDANLDLLLNSTVHLEAGTEQIASSMRLTSGGSSSITALKSRTA
jgi:hypothetical protein